MLNKSSHLPQIYCALDTTDRTFIDRIIRDVGPLGLGVKLGLTFLGVHGAQGIKEIKNAYPGLSIFLDAKLHDIPAQVAGAVTSYASLDVDFITLHAQGGEEMMRQAQEAAEASSHVPTLLAVTILTALDDDNIRATGYEKPVAQIVPKLAALAQQSNVPGIVCSPLEIASIREKLGNDLTLMVPGIRPASHATKTPDDQKRVLTPKEAIDYGANHLVIGRPITQAETPAQAARDILEEIN